MILYFTASNGISRLTLVQEFTLLSHTLYPGNKRYCSKYYYTYILNIYKIYYLIICFSIEKLYLFLKN